MENNMTAVEWLVEQYEKSFTLEINKVMTGKIEQAKAMEREQIIEAFDKAYPYDIIGYDAAEQYYNETYKKDKNDNNIW